MNDFMGANVVAKWLLDNHISKEEFTRDPKKWIDLAMRAIKTQNGEVRPGPTNESLFSVKQYFSRR